MEEVEEVDTAAAAEDTAADVAEAAEVGL